MTNIPQIH